MRCVQAAGRQGLWGSDTSTPHGCSAACKCAASLGMRSSPRAARLIRDGGERLAGSITAAPQVIKAASVYTKRREMKTTPAECKEAGMGWVFFCSSALSYFFTHTHKHAHTNTRTHTNTHTNTHKQTNTRTQTNTHTNKHKNTQTHTQTRSHTHTQAHRRRLRARKKKVSLLSLCAPGCLPG